MPHKSIYSMFPFSMMKIKIIFQIIPLPNFSFLIFLSLCCNLFMFTRIRNIGIIIITTEITGQINHFAVYISHEILPCET